VVPVSLRSQKEIGARYVTMVVTHSTAVTGVQRFTTWVAMCPLSLGNQPMTGFVYSAVPSTKFSRYPKVRKGRGNLSERDLKLCRRLLLEMYQLWPESVPFRDCADLNFPQYLEKIKDPIALDVIKERLDDENNDQYSSVRNFLADLRKMFRNCFLFNSRESEIYRHAKKLEEKLDQLLQMWLPEFAFDPLTDVVDTNSKSSKRSASPTAGSSKKKKGNDGKRKRKKKKKYMDSDDQSNSDSDDQSGVEFL